MLLAENEVITAIMTGNGLAYAYGHKDGNAYYHIGVADSVMEARDAVEDVPNAFIIEMREISVL